MSYIDDMGIEIDEDRKPWPLWVRLLPVVVAVVSLGVIYPTAALVVLVGLVVLGLVVMLLGGLLAMGTGTVR